jgi:hypothetical protein
MSDESMRTTRRILWHDPDMPSTEVCTLIDEPGQKRMAGTVLTVRPGEPVEIRYELVCDASWRTRACTVDVEGASTRERIALMVGEDGVWKRDGVPVPDLAAGAPYVDLGFSPCTNTLPIRGLTLEAGQSARITVAWLRFPELDLVRAEQVYTHLSGSRYRFETGDGDFGAELDVDPHGIVTRYGSYWREVPPPDQLS